MRFTWKQVGVSGAAWDGTCADESQSVRLTRGADGQWRGRVRCGVMQKTYDVLPAVDLATAKQSAQAIANRSRAGYIEQGVVPGEDRIVYLVVTQPGGVDGRDTSAKGGEVALATFDKAEAMAKVGHGGWYRLETKVVDVATARREALSKLSPLDRLMLATPEAAAILGIGCDPREGNRG